jgi:hypothetical protein
MYASIRRYEGVDRETAIEVSAKGYVESRRRLAEMPGFVAYELVIGDDDSLTAISIFDNWMTAEESNLYAAQWIAENARTNRLPPPRITQGEFHTQPGEAEPFGFRPKKVKLPANTDVRSTL